jgi:hypothetical protein
MEDIKNPAMIKIKIILTRELNKNPIKAPKADFKACSESFFATSSPKTAPKKGPIITPKKPKKNIPTKDPRKAPSIPSLLALYFLAPSKGATRSNIKVKTINPKKTKTVIKEIFSKLVNIANIKIPSQAKGTAGKKGRITPKSPKKIKKRQKMNNNNMVSMVSFYQKTAFLAIFLFTYYSTTSKERREKTSSG